MGRVITGKLDVHERKRNLWEINLHRLVSIVQTDVGE